MRKALRKFAEKQEQVLKENDHKGGWDNCAYKWLWARAFDEMLELRDALHGKGNVIKECCDVANFMMMIADDYIEK